MERANLGPPIQFQDDAGAWHVGRKVCDEYGYCCISPNHPDKVLVRIHDTGELVFVDFRKCEPNVPNPPLPAESQSWHDMMDEVARLPEE